MSRTCSNAHHSDAQKTKRFTRVLVTPALARFASWFRSVLWVGARRPRVEDCRQTNRSDPHVMRRQDAPESRFPLGQVKNHEVAQG